MERVIDYICGMNMTIDGAVASSEFNGKTYYFCSDDCKEEFNSDPEFYLDIEEEE